MLPKLNLLSFVVRLLADAINFVIFTCVSTFVTYVFCHCLGHGLGNSNTRTMEPIATDVASNVKPKV